MKLTKQSNYIGKVRTNIEEYIPQLEVDLENIFLAMKGRIRFGTGVDGARGENISGEFQIYTSNGSADTEDTITHTLGSVPIGFIVINTNKGGVTYDGGTAWTATSIFLKNSTTSATTTIFILK